MLPALTFAPRRVALRSRRFVAGAAGIALLAAAVVAMLGSASPSADETAARRSLAQRLSEATWALAVPTAWLAAPVAEIHSGDSVDLIAVRMGDRPLAVPIAADLRVMGADVAAVIFQVDEETATAIASARASGLLIVPLLRSSR
jgi:threonine dehydrogenase-like Zn-dependent dehydrogenase